MVCSMSDFFHEAVPDPKRLEALEIMHSIDRHYYFIVTRRPELAVPFLRRNGVALPDNVWIGTAVESAKYTHRLDIIRTVPAAMRVAVFEPLIADVGDIDLTGYGWVITGGETGRRARKIAPEWVESIDRQCREQSVPHRFKGWGMPQHNPLYAEALSLKLDPAEYVLQHDLKGTGGSLLKGEYIKGNPIGFEILDQV